MKREKGIVLDKDRHGNLRCYYRRAGLPKIRLREPYGSDAFYDELACARLGQPYVKADTRPKPMAETAGKGTFAWLVREYLRRNKALLAKSTLEQKRRVLEGIGDETCLSKSGQRLAEMAFAGLRSSHIATLRDQKIEAPEAANHRIKALSALFRWAVEEKLASANPAETVKKIETASTGHHPLTEAEMQAYLDTHGPGTKARLAFLIFRYTSLRVSDVSKLGRQHLYWTTDQDADGNEIRIQRFAIRPKKTARKSGTVVDMIVLPPLAEAIAALPADGGHLALLINDHGKPYSEKGLGQRMRKWFDEAGLTHCSSHGIRKANAVTAAENGATAAQLLSMFGWTQLRQAEGYTRSAERKRLADEGAPRLLSRPKKVGQPRP
jgi:site-specific recombinase XerD